MHSQKKHPKQFSFEFFPPKTEEGKVRLRETRDQLAKLKPKYFSVTFGAGGSTQQGTYDTVVEIQRDTGIDAAPHLSCIGSTHDNVRAMLKNYQAQGIRRIVALRGDMPSGMVEAGEFRHANELVAFIRAEAGTHFHIEVAAYPEIHPQASNATADIEHFVKKIRAGADSAITQYFYNADAYYRFVDSCEQRGVVVAIVPGIMPITNYKQLARFSDACGAELPRWLRKRLEEFGDDLESIRAFGLDYTTDLCRRLLDQGAPGLHFYTMNQAGPTTTVYNNLKLDKL